jgi:DNA-binding MarR family transcriptional regulator
MLNNVSEADHDRSLTSRLRLAVMRLNRRLRAQRTDAAVTLSQVSAMSCLHKCGSLSPGELAAKEGVQPPSMTRVVAALEEMGFVHKRQHPSDGRQSIIELTDKGIAHLHADICAREAWLDARLAELTPSDRKVLEEASEIIDRMAGM